jgi:hypothetical protein
MDPNPERLERPCTLGQAKRIVGHHLQVLWDDPERARALPPLMLWGPPGVGKSAVFAQVSEELGIEFLDVRLAQREPVDIRGLPVPKEDGVHWLTAAEWPRSGRGIILFDELTSADRSLQVAAYEFILDRRLGDLYRVPDGWYLCGAGNRSEDRAVTSTLSSALANRFCHLEVEAELEDWVSWARTARIHPDVIAFLRFEPRLLFQLTGDTQKGWPSPRSWERVSLEVEHAVRLGLDEASLALIVQGLVGPAAATEFLAFRSWSSELPAVRAMMTGQLPISIPKRADQRYALACAAAHHASREPELLGGLLELSGAMTSDFALMCVLDYLGADGERSVARRMKELSAHPGFADWKRHHGSALRARLPSLGADGELGASG